MALAGMLSRVVAWEEQLKHIVAFEDLGWSAWVAYFVDSPFALEVE